jgi:hypothetical protein
MFSLAAGLHGIAMKFSAEKASRKWPCGALGRGGGAFVTVATALLMLYAPIEPAAAARKSDARVQAPGSRPAGETRPKPGRTALLQSVPLPKPRPADAPASAPGGAAAGKQMPESAKPAEPQAAPVPPPPSACRLALSEAIAIAPSIPDIHGAGGCGGEDLVRLEAVVLPDKHLVSVKPAAILRCAMASEIANWIRADIAPLAMSMGSVISDLDNFDSFECRGRNRVPGAPLSEHGRANALDIRALKLANGQSIALTDRALSRGLRESVRQSACARFSTVLGPGSDWYHEDHIHLDLMERRNNYKICQWDVWDPLPQIAPRLPAERPDEAPPREVAATSEAPKSDAAKAYPAKSETVEPEVAGSGELTKKRRENRRF